MKWVIALHFLLFNTPGDVTLVRPMYDTEEQCLKAAVQVIEVYEEMEDTDITDLSAVCVQRKIEQEEIWM